MNLKKSLTRVFSANIVQLVSSAIVGFVIPAILSIDNYAKYKTYTLLISYLGLLHFGYPDGLYIKYGGKKYSEISKEKRLSEFCTFLLLELVVFFVLLLIFIFTKNISILLVSLTLFPYMISTYYKTLYQGVGYFERYTKIIHFYSISYLIFNIVLVFLVKSDNYIFYCLSTLFAHFISSITCLFFLFKEKDAISLNIDFRNYKIIKVGFFVLLGNFALMLFFGIDRWCVKIFLNSHDFAYYSFAVNLLNIITVLINAISVTFYSYLFKNGNDKNIDKLKDSLLVIGMISSAAFFVLKIIINIFLKKYIPSLVVISNTFATFPYMAVINSLYINLYKIKKDEKHYFGVVISMLLVGFVLNIVGILIFNSIFAVSLATLLSFIIWFIYSTFDLKRVAINIKNVISLFIVTSIFLISSHFTNVYYGMLVYTIAIICVIKFIYYDTIVMLIKNILKKKGSNL